MIRPPAHYTVLAHFGPTGWGHVGDPQGSLGAAADWYAEARDDGYPARVLLVDPPNGLVSDVTADADDVIRARVAQRGIAVPDWLEAA